MKIVITADSEKIDSNIDPRFGRGAYFIVIDPNTQEWQAYNNPAMEASGGAGSQAAQFIVEKGASAVVSGHFGPNAFQALEAAGVAMYRFGDQMTVREVIEDFNNAKLQTVKTAGQSHRRVD